MPPLRIVVSGYYGCGNTGDEAVLAGMVESFRHRAGPDAATFTVLSADPEDTRRRHGVDAIDRTGYGSIRRALAGTDLFLSGGGSLLQDRTSLRSLVYYLGIIRLARSSKKPVMLYAQGIGPLGRPLARALTRRVLNRVQYITVRDGPSADLLSAMRVSVPPIEVTADPAFVLGPEASPDPRSRLDAAGVPWGMPVVGVALRPWRKGGPAVEEYARATDAISERSRAHIALLPMQHPGDVTLAREVARAALCRPTVIEACLSPAAVLGVVGELSGLVAMRLHALVFGAAQGVPMVALSYDPKVRCLMDTLGQRDMVVDVAGLSADAVALRIAGAIDQGECLRASLRQRATELRDLALSNVDRALGLV